MGWYRLDVAVGHPQFGKLQQCHECQAWQTARREIGHQLRKRMAEFGLDMLEQMTFESFDAKRHPDVQQAYTAARGFARKPSRCLILWGLYGTGKSHLCNAVGNALLAEGKNVLAFTAPDFLDMLRSGYTDNSYNSLLNVVKTAEVLIIDDLGTQKDTEWAEEKLFQVVNYRYRKMLPLLVSTNSNPAELNPRLADRLCDERWSLRVAINAPSYRRMKK